MFYNGIYKVTMDANKRVKLPVAFQKDFEGQLVLVRSYHGLSVYTEQTYNDMISAMYEHADFDNSELEKIRFLSRHSTTLAIDGQHRFTIPTLLVEQLGLTNELAVTGEGKTLGICNYSDTVNEADGDVFIPENYPKGTL